MEQISSDAQKDAVLFAERKLKELEPLLRGEQGTYVDRVKAEQDQVVFKQILLRAKSLPLTN